jgi:hypothetical protein
MDMDRRNLIAQWAFDTRSILGRFHLWLEDVELEWVQGGCKRDFSFVGESLERAFIAAAAVTALGTRLWGRFGEAKRGDKATLNRVKKDADAVSAYALSEALWYLTRSLPENHAVMVSLGEGLMPKAGETPEMGSNPLLGFGRVYARPQVARFLDRRVNRLINEEGYEWSQFWGDIQSHGITVWGAAVDTLENTSRFAKGDYTGPLTVLHLFDQPLKVARPYEGYMGNIVLPKDVVDHASRESILINYLTPRRLIMAAIRETYPDIRAENVHVWTLGGKSRVNRIGSLWDEWKDLGVHLIENGWVIPQTGKAVFTESGTYAPSFRIGAYRDEYGEPHVFICDGYAATAEAMQAASLDPVLNTVTSMALFSSKFTVPWNREHQIMHIDPDSERLADELTKILETEVSEELSEEYRQILVNARQAGMPMHKRTILADDLFPNKDWSVLALAGYMLPDPYTGAEGVVETRENVYRVTTHAATRRGILEVKLSLRLMEPNEEMRLVFSPLLDRFYSGQDYTNRPVKISDSGRIRNELQTLCSEALEPLPGDRIKVHFEQIDDAVMPHDKKRLIQEVLTWYKEKHPIWFQWLETSI